MKISELRKNIPLEALIVAFLLTIFSGIVLNSWILTLWQRPLEQNLIQLGSGAILILALFQLLKKNKHKILIAKTAFNASWVGLSLLILVLFFHMLFDFLHIKSLYWMSYLGIVSFSCWTLLGFQRFLKCLPYFLFSAFLLPVINAEIHTAISLPLQLTSTWLATQFSALFIPLTYHQNMMYIKGETFEITADCSGLQSWVGFIFAGLLKQIFEGLQTLELTLLVPIALILALFLNSIRLSLTALVAYFNSADQAVAIHTNLDYILLPIGFYVIWESGTWLKRKLPFGKTKSDVQSYKAASPFKNKLIGGIAACALLSVLAFHGAVNPPSLQALQTPLKVPLELSDWKGSELSLSEAEKKSLAGAQIINRTYRRNDQRLLVTVLQSDSPEYIHNFWGCLMGQGIQPKQIAHLKLSLHQRDYHIPVIQYKYENQLYYEAIWYQWRSGITANRWDWYKAVLQSHFGQPQSNWKVVTVTMPLTTKAPQKSPKQDIQTLQNFSTLVLKALDKTRLD